MSSLPVFGGARDLRSLVSVYCFVDYCVFFCLFFRLAIELSVLLWYTAYGCPFCIFKLFFKLFVIKQSYSTFEKSLKIPKGQSEDVDKRRTYNSMATTIKGMKTTKISGVPEVIWKHDLWTVSLLSCKHL